MLGLNGEETNYNMQSHIPQPVQVNSSFITSSKVSLKDLLFEVENDQSETISCIQTRAESTLNTPHTNPLNEIYKLGFSSSKISAFLLELGRQILEFCPFSLLIKLEKAMMIKTF